MSAVMLKLRGVLSFTVFAVACGGSMRDDISRGPRRTSIDGGSMDASMGEGGAHTSSGRREGGAGGASAGQGGLLTGGGRAVSAGGGCIGVGGFCTVNCFDPPSEPPAGTSLCGGVECKATEECCFLTMTCFDRSKPSLCAKPPPDADPQCRQTCASNADCGDDAYCASDSVTLCGGPGHCESRTNCGTSYTGSYCGCDGKTYPDVQTACFHGVRSVAHTACGEVTLIGQGGGSSGKAVIYCGGSAQCGDAELCCPITGMCYDAARPALCAPPPPGTLRACVTDADCVPLVEFCDSESCDGPGGCVDFRFKRCGPEYEPVCGCNGHTYQNAVCAETASMRVRSKGACQ